jgi:AbrB family transcriptional regulator, transcriptional pleiotropic regulator of transition state genes
MKSTGIVRKIDELGRVVLPIELRRTLNLEVRDPVEIFIDGDSIVLRKYDAACLFCGAPRNLLSYRGKQICRDCLRRLREETADN